MSRRNLPEVAEGWVKILRSCGRPRSIQSIITQSCFHLQEKIQFPQSELPQFPIQKFVQLEGVSWAKGQFTILSAELEHSIRQQLRFLTLKLQIIQKYSPVKMDLNWTGTTIKLANCCIKFKTPGPQFLPTFIIDFHWAGMKRLFLWMLVQ